MRQVAVKTESQPEPSTSKPVKTFQSFQPPRLNIFSVSTDKKTGETIYPLWRYEIEGLKKGPDSFGRTWDPRQH